MAVITMPAAMARAAEWSVGQVTHGIAETSETTGAQAERPLGPPQWTVSLRSVSAMTLAEAAWWECTLLQLRGGVNALAVWDPVRVAPQGTLRGTPTLLADAAAGANTATLIATAGQTLLMGDWLQLGSGLFTGQLVKCVADTVADGSGHMPVTFEPPLRYLFAAGSAITWLRPVAHYRLQGNVQSQYRSGLFKQGGFAVDLVETWR